MNDLNDKQIEMLLIIYAKSSKEKSTHVITIDKIRKKKSSQLRFVIIARQSIRFVESIIILLNAHHASK
jgi:hypothetical protein